MIALLSASGVANHVIPPHRLDAEFFCCVGSVLGASSKLQPIINYLWGYFWGGGMVGEQLMINFGWIFTDFLTGFIGYYKKCYKSLGIYSISGKNAIILGGFIASVAKLL